MSQIKFSLKRIDVKKLTLLIGAILALLLAGFSVFYFVKDSAHWHVYLFFFTIGIVFLVLFYIEKNKVW